MENGTKLRILYLYQYLLRNSYIESPKSTAERKIPEQDYGVKAARNTISDDLAMLVNS